MRLIGTKPHNADYAGRCKLLISGTKWQDLRTTGMRTCWVDVGEFDAVELWRDRGCPVGVLERQCYHGGKHEDVL
jgi:hypothetical protein